MPECEEDYKIIEAAWDHITQNAMSGHTLPVQAALLQCMIHMYTYRRIEATLRLGLIDIAAAIREGNPV
jgi:hypothetical protein